jgi:hypothetical protein
MADSYQIFHPINGTHIRYATEEEALAGFVQVMKDVIEIHKAAAVKEIMYENGDVTWEPVDFSSRVVIST